MSAYLDKSQGVTFVFSNIHEIYHKAKNARLDSPFVADRAVVRAPALAPEVPPVTTARVLKAKELETVKIEPFKPSEIKPEENGERPFAVPMGVREAEEKAKRLGMRPVANIQKSLDQLSDAQSKLRFLLQELEALTKKKS